jgi:hypothetical protein
VSKTCGALFLSVLLTACATPAQLSPGDGRAFELSVAYIGGRPAVAWYGGSARHEALFLRYASATGEPRGAVQQLTDATRDAYEPSLQEMDGEAVVAWYEQEGDSRSGGVRRQVALLARFDADGKRRWQRQLSADDAQGRIPVVRVHGGIIHAAWVEQRDGAEPRIRVASLDAAGQWLQMPRDAVAVDGNTWNLNATVGADGFFHVLYDSDRGGHAREVHWLRVRDAGIEDQRISTDDGRESAYPDIALDGTRVVLTWFDSRDGNAEVYLRCTRLDASGAPPADLRLDDAAARRVTHTPGDSIGAYVTWHDGGIELAWTEVGERRRLLLQRFDRDCRAVGAATEMAGARGAAGIASLASSQAGLALAWDEQRRDASAHGREVTSVAVLRAWPHRGPR